MRVNGLNVARCRDYPYTWRAINNWSNPTEERSPYIFLFFFFILREGGASFWEIATRAKKSQYYDALLLGRSNTKRYRTLLKKHEDHRLGLLAEGTTSLSQKRLRINSISSHKKFSYIPHALCIDVTDWNSAENGNGRTRNGIR